MRSFLHITIVIAVLLLAVSMAAGQSQFRVSDDQVMQLLARLDTNSENLHRTLVQAIDKSFLRNAELGRYLKDYSAEFERLADRLKSRSGDRKPIASEAQEILNRGFYLQLYISSYDFGSEANQAWQQVTSDLNQLADYYKVETNWAARKNIGNPGLLASAGSTPAVETDMLSNHLIGTYKIEKTGSGDAREEIERAVKELPQEARRRTLSRMLPRMRSPRLLAIDRKSDRVTLASSLHPARVYNATGIAYGNRGPVERTMLYGGQFQLTTPDEIDTYYSVTYTTIDRGARLRVTNTVLSSQFARPLIVVSYYKKISDEPRLNLDEETDIGPERLGTRGQGRP